MSSKKQPRKRKNYAFIDNQNVNVSVQRLGWKIDWAKMIKRLRKDFNVGVAYLFMGYIPEYQKMYDFFESLGYTLVFKKVHQAEHIPNKGNIDTDLVLQAMIDYRAYEQAVIVSGDGDFTSLVEYLMTKNKLRCVLAPNKRRTSDFLQEATEGRFLFMDGLKRKLAYTGEKKTEEVKSKKVIKSKRDKGGEVKSQRGTKSKRKDQNDHTQKKVQKKGPSQTSEAKGKPKPTKVSKKRSENQKSPPKVKKKPSTQRMKKKKTTQVNEPFWM